MELEKMFEGLHDPLLNILERGGATSVLNGVGLVEE